jgi:hypothetical protein
MRERIKEICRQRGHEAEAQAFLGSSQTIVETKWWRSGLNERIEEHELRGESAATNSVTAFDGQVVRTLGEGGEGLVGSIHTAESAHWLNSTRVHPFSLLYECAMRPYSELVEGSKEFRARAVDRADGGTLEVFFRHPQFDASSYLLYFDSENRLVERRMLYVLPPEGERVWESHVFNDYRKQLHSSGEAIWFPHKAVYHYYMGVSADGTLAEYKTMEITIAEAKFNVEIPDDKFSLAFPPGIRIWDGVHEMGFLEGDEASATVGGVSGEYDSGLPPRRNSKWPLIVAVVVAAMLAVALVVRVRRSR